MSPISYIGNKDLIILGGKKPRSYKSNLCFSAKVKAKIKSRCFIHPGSGHKTRPLG